jgi:SAM-dependent methyltransferase
VIPLSSISPAAASATKAIDPLELYASAIDTSDYVAKVAPLVRRAVPELGDLLDVGAGGGQLGHALRQPGKRSLAIEPSARMRVRLAALDPPPEIVAGGWQDVEVPTASVDTVLAATMPAYFDEPELFLARCHLWARRAIVWVVPAQAGPRGLCFAGCLPKEWHGEDETPGIDLVRRALPPASRPREIVFVRWTFTGVVTDLDRLAAYLAERLAWAASDVRRDLLARHLASQSKPDAAGWRLDIPRKSAVCIWGKQ